MYYFRIFVEFCKLFDRCFFCKIMQPFYLKFLGMIDKVAKNKESNKKVKFRSDSSSERLKRRINPKMYSYSYKRGRSYHDPDVFFNLSTLCYTQEETINWPVICRRDSKRTWDLWTCSCFYSKESFKGAF